LESSHAVFPSKKQCAKTLEEDAMGTPFHEIKKIPAMRAIGCRANVSLWDVDTAFSRLYDKALEHKLMFREPGLGIRREGLVLPDAFLADYEVLFPLTGEPEGEVPGAEILDLPEREVASFVHRGPYHWISCTYEKVLEWVRENRYVVDGEPREVFFVAPDPHAGGTQDDMLTEIQVPIRNTA
jgi:effector-binding domain-containing protein